MQLSYYILISLSFLIFEIRAACPSGWSESLVDETRCYFFALNKLGWFDAEAYCENMIVPHAHLTSILSAFETSDISSIVANNPAIGALDELWIGASGHDGIFTWSDKSPFVYTNWLAGQPDISQPCVSTLAKSGGRWKTDHCYTDNFFICKYIQQKTSEPSDCYDWYFNNGNVTSGIYRISPDGPPFEVFCEMDTDEGGWTVIQRLRSQNSVESTRKEELCNNRTNQSLLMSLSAHDPIQFPCAYRTQRYEPFQTFQVLEMDADANVLNIPNRRLDGNLSFWDKKWNEYNAGFNNGLENNFWLGNVNIHTLTNIFADTELRIDMWGDRGPNAPNPNGYWFEKYSGFHTDDEEHKWELNLLYTSVGNASTTESSVFGFGASVGHPFSAFDVDHSYNGHQNCSGSPSFEYGGWWYGGACGSVALNGKYVPRMWNSAYGLVWLTSDYRMINPIQTRMMVRSLHVPISSRRYPVRIPNINSQNKIP